MRRTLVLALLAVVVLAGCGSSSSGSPNPVNRELSYFSASSPFVMSVMTDPHSAAVKDAQALLGRFSLATFGQSALMAKLDQLGIDYANDVRPLFGNPVMFGESIAGLSAASESTNFLAVWITKDAGKLSALIKKLHGLRGAGSHDGATLYEAGNSATLAVDGATILLGPSVSQVDAALDRHAHSGGISSSDYARAFQGLPQGSLIEAFGNLGGVLSRPSAAKARRVPWVAALRGYAASVSASSSGLTIRYRLDTTGRSLTAAQVPLSTATAVPQLAGSLPITVGIEDPSHIFSFAEATEHQTSPGGYGRFLRRQAAVRAKTGVDLNSLLKLATGSLIIASSTHTTVARARVSDPAAAARTLSKLMTQPQSVLDKATAWPTWAAASTRLGSGVRRSPLASPPDSSWSAKPPPDSCGLSLPRRQRLLRGRREASASGSDLYSCCGSR
jgi:Protein of unknown function (DUF3352)